MDFLFLWPLVQRAARPTQQPFMGNSWWPEFAGYARLADWLDTSASFVTSLGSHLITRSESGHFIPTTVFILIHPWD